MSQLPPPNFSRSELPEHKHQRILLAALQNGHPVEVAGKVEHIHTVSAQRAGGRIDMVVYLSGDPTPIDAPLVSLQKQPE
ncbi:MAG TPA: hypothetical protein VF800_02900 [Telluria sp.]|jgi:hypothetical protein